MALRNVSKFLGLLLLASGVSLSKQIECASSYNLNYGEMGEVSCEYPLSFLSVRWYKGSDSQPIAYIEGGSKSVTQGFDITVRGNLQINQVDVRHAGMYNITVLDIDGRSESKTIKAHVTAGLTEKPFLETCVSSRLTMCSNITEQRKPTTLVCLTHNTLPAVDLQWYGLLDEQNQILNSSSFQNSRNDTTMLFSSYSTLAYEPTAFTLNVFTCKATGLAAPNDAWQSSMLVEGLVPPRKTDQIVHHVEMNAIVNIKCSDSIPIVASWKVVYPNGTEKSLWNLYPGSASGNCSIGNGCYVDHKGALTVYNAQQWAEASYECLYYDGDQSGRTVVQLSVIVRPEPYRIVVQGCNDTLNCDVKVSTRIGSFKASVYGARPAAHLLCEIADESKSKAFVVNKEDNIVENEEKGTFDTTVTVDYDIQECNERVHVICQVSPNTVHENLYLDIFLITDTSGCSSLNTGLVVGLVVGILIFIIAVSIVVYIKLRKGRGGNNRTKSAKDDEQNQLEGQDKEKEPLLEDTFDSDFNSFCFQVEETKVVPEKEFRSLISYFEKQDETKAPSTVLVNHITKTDQTEEVLYIVLRYLAKENTQDKVSTKTFCKLVEHLAENNKLSVENFTKVFESMISNLKITQSDFKNAEMGLLDSNNIHDNSKVVILVKGIEKGKTTKEDLVHTFLNYALNKKIEKDTFFKLPSSLQVPYTNFLHEIHEVYKKGQNDENMLLTLLHGILKENGKNHELLIINKHAQDKNEVNEEDLDQNKKQMQENLQTQEDGEQNDTSKITPNQETERDEKDNNQIKDEDPEERRDTSNSNGGLDMSEDFTSIYVQGLLCSVLDDTVNLQLCGELLESGMKSNKNEIFEYNKAYHSSLQHGKRDETFWIRYIANLWTMNVVTEELKSSFILKIVNLYLMLREDVKKAIGDLMKKSERQDFLGPIEFKDDEIKKRKKGESGKAGQRAHEQEK